MTGGRELPGWARWSPAGAARPWTVGVEEEVLLLDRRNASVANRGGEVLAALGPGTPASAETHACVVELVTRPHETVAGVTAEIAEHRRGLLEVLDALGLAAGVAGTHPFAVWTEVEISDTPRYRRLHASLRALARREPTCALHVHVAVPDSRAAARALRGLRQDLPVLLALSANSPFWQGRDTGLASARVPLLSMFPRMGLPGDFSDYGAYVEAVDALVRTGAIPDASHIWWAARLQPRLGTVEVRAMDAQTEPADAAALTALVQCLVRLYALTGPLEVVPSPEVLDENRFLAARDGMAARLVGAGGPEPAAERLERLLARCRPLAGSLGCAAELEDVRRLAAEPGHARQRAAARVGGAPGVAAHLARRFGAREPRSTLAASIA